MFDIVVKTALACTAHITQIKTTFQPTILGNNFRPPIIKPLQQRDNTIISTRTTNQH